MATLAFIPVPFSSTAKLIATVSRDCGRELSVLRPSRLAEHVRAGDTFHLALLAPELHFPIDVHATVLARTYRPQALKLRYQLADVQQMEWALGQLYRCTRPELPVSLDVQLSADERPGAVPRCRLSALSCDGATFEVRGQLGVGRCAPDSVVRVRLPHVAGHVVVPGHVAWVTPRPTRSRLHVDFNGINDECKRRLGDIVYRFRLGAAPWTPRLDAPGL